MQTHVRRRLFFAAVVVLVLIAAAGVTFVIWALSPLGPQEQAIAALESDEEVAVHKHDQGWYVFAPVDHLPEEASQPWNADPLLTMGPQETGLIVYPGARVDYRSYAPLLRRVAEAGYPAVLVPAPLNLMVFAPNRAVDVVAAYPDVRQWAVAGHSLGAAMAARFVSLLDEEEVARSQVRGLLMLAGYPAERWDLSDRSLRVTSIAAERDEVYDRERWVESRDQLPPHARFEVIEGGNHAGFGHYGRQSGDGEAEISREQQQRRTADIIVEFLERVRPLQ